MGLSRFEFDPAKSTANMEKHGLDFHQAKQLWQDTRRVEFPARSSDENRFIVVGTIAGTHWTAVITYRGDIVRLISVRRSRRKEIDEYQG